LGLQPGLDVSKVLGETREKFIASARDEAAGKSLRRWIEA
jgi:hypothetical protein